MCHSPKFSPASMRRSAYTRVLVLKVRSHQCSKAPQGGSPPRSFSRTPFGCVLCNDIRSKKPDYMASCALRAAFSSSPIRTSLASSFLASGADFSARVETPFLAAEIFAFTAAPMLPPLPPGFWFRRMPVPSSIRPYQKMKNFCQSKATFWLSPARITRGYGTNLFGTLTLLRLKGSRTARSDSRCSDMSHAYKVLPV